MTSNEARASLALRAAAILAVDPSGLAGVVLRGAGGPVRDRWLDAFRSLLSSDVGWRRLPPQVAEGRLIGGLDLAATLAVGRPVAERGLLAEADGGVLLVPMAERLEGTPASHICAALDTGEIIVERDGIAMRTPSRFAAVLLDEGIDDERPPTALTERVGFALDLDDLRIQDFQGSESALSSLDEIEQARRRLPKVGCRGAALEALVGAGVAFGIPSLRLATLALRAAKAAAALAGRNEVKAEDAEVAAALVLAPRATMLPPASESEDVNEPDAPPPPDPESTDADAATDPAEAKPMADSVAEATRAAIPADLLALLSSGLDMRPKSAAGGRRGVAQASLRRGRPAGVRRGAPGHGVRLAVVETLRAAAPWQKLRRKGAASPSSRVEVRREDFRIARFKERSESLMIFVVDASGSAALHRLAEAKGAVELILAECYVRRDSVALIAFRGERAELVLPPTRSLTRAKRALAGQAGGGGTPLGAAIDASNLLAQSARKQGRRPLVVLMTDGKANVARSGKPGRAEAEADAAAAAHAFRLGGAAGLVLDIAPRPGEAAARLAASMGARYIPLPYADAQLVSRAVLAASPGS